jgi:hypothetical protein
MSRHERKVSGIRRLDPKHVPGPVQAANETMIVYMYARTIEKQLDRIEHVHRFTRAVSVGNPREFLQAEKEDQEMAEACKRLIKNCIICWNYIYLSQKLEEIEDAASRQVFLDAVAHGSVISWQHINLLGEYDFSDEKLQDNVGIRPPKLTP